MKTILTILLAISMVASCAPPRKPITPKRPPRPPHAYTSPYHHDSVKNVYGIRAMIIKMSYLC